MLLDIYVFFFVLVFFGLCIFLHELGHFLAAKWRGLHIIAFSIGFKKVWGYKYKGVEYRIGCIPFGGYVDLPQIDCTGEARDENGNVLPSVKPLDKIIVAFSGPFFNVLFGLALGTIIWIHGFPMDTPKMPAFQIASVTDDSPEYKAGLRKDDIVEKVNGKAFYATWNDIVRKVLFTVGDVELSVLRGNERLEIKYKPAVNKKVMAEEGIAYPYFLPKILVLVPMKDSPADKAGIRKNDIVLKIDGAELGGYDDFIKKVNESVGRPMVFTVYRQGKIIEVGGVSAIKEDTGLYKIGVNHDPSHLPIVIGDVLPGSPAEKAGFVKGDVVKKIDGKSITVPEMFSMLIQQSMGKEMEFIVSRGENLVTLKVFPKQMKEYTIGLEEVFYNYPNPFEQFMDVIDMTYKSVRGMICKAIWGTSTLKPSHMSGPVGIVAIIGKTVYRGNFIQAIYIVVMITFSLAILNLLPIPVLDGGHIVLATLESIRRKPVPESMVKPVFIVFITLLIGLMIFVTYADFKRFILPKVKPVTATEALKEKPAEEKPAEEKAKEEPKP